MRSVARNAFRPLHRSALISVPRTFERQLTIKALRPAEQPIPVKNVRFTQPPFFSQRRFARIIVWTATTYIVLSALGKQLGISVEIEEVEKDGKKSPGSGIEVTDEDEEELEEGDFFIPFTRAVTLPKTYYKGSDPEWQEFMKIAKDEERRTVLCERLKSEVSALVQKRPDFRQMLGTGITPGKHWLEFHFPDGPRPDHERDGLMIGNGRIAWVSEIVDDGTFRRQSRLIWPVDAITAAWNTSELACKMLYRSCLFSLDLAKSSHAAPMDRTWHKVDAWIRAVTTQTDASKWLGKESTSTSTDDTAQRTWPISMLVPANDGLRRQLSDPGLSGTLCRSGYMLWSQFKFNLATKTAQRLPPLPRGAFVMHGLTEMRGSRGRLLFDIKAFYDPKTDQFVSIIPKIKAYKVWDQRPRGGA